MRIERFVVSTFVLIKLEHAYLLAALVAMITAVCVWNLRSLDTSEKAPSIPLFTLAIGLNAVALFIAAMGIDGDMLAGADSFPTREAVAFVATIGTIVGVEVAVRIATGYRRLRWLWLQLTAAVLILSLLHLNSGNDRHWALTSAALLAVIMVVTTLRIMTAPPEGNGEFRKLTLAILVSQAAACAAEYYLVAAEHWVLGQGPIEFTLPIALVAMARFLLPIAFTAVVVLTLTSRNLQELQHRAETDALTNLTARGSLAEHGESLLGRTRLEGKLVAVLMIDIDHFKAVNDRHGHEVGDGVLKHCARIVRKSLRPEAVVARYGGEEFCAIVPINQADDARIVAERLRLAIANTPYRRSGVAGQSENLLIPVTVSVGGTIAAQGEMLESLLKTADLELYKAKHAGRNRVSVAHHELTGEDLLIVV